MPPIHWPKSPRATPAGTAAPPDAPRPPHNAARCAPWRVRWALGRHGPQTKKVGVSRSDGENMVVDVGNMVVYVGKMVVGLGKTGGLIGENGKTSDSTSKKAGKHMRFNFLLGNMWM